MKVTKTENKLIRDNIPTRLKNEGVEVDVEVVTDEVRFLRLLLDQLELTAQDASLTFDDALLSELANLETVIDGILSAKGYTREQLSDRQKSLEKDQGTYSERYFLRGTSSDDEIEEEPDDSN